MITRINSKPEILTANKFNLTRTQAPSLQSTMKKGSTNLLPKLDLQAAVKMAVQKADGDLKLNTFDMRKRFTQQ
jgi:hypothetical protein